MGWNSFQYFNRQHRKHTGWQSPIKVDCRCGGKYTIYPNYRGGYPDAKKTHERSKKHLVFSGEWNDSSEKKTSDYKKLLNAREKARVKSILTQAKNTTNVAPQFDISDNCAPQINISSDIAAEDNVTTDIAPQDNNNTNSDTVASKTKVAKSMKAKVTKAKVTKTKVTKAKVTKAKAKKVA